MNFVDIQSLKCDEKFLHGGVSIARVMAAKLYNTDIKSIFKYFVLSILYEPKYEIATKAKFSKVLLSKNYDPSLRRDYNHIYNSFHDLSHFDEVVFRRDLSLLSIVGNAISLFRIFKKNKRLKLPCKEMMAVSFLESYYYRAYQLFDQIDFSRYLSYVSFCDSYLEENLMAQLANSKGLTTATLQHGQYKVNSPGRESTDCEAYLNFVSDYLFAWGQATKDEFVSQGIESERILCCGALKPYYNQTESDEVSRLDGVCVILNGDSHSKSNISMLNVVRDFCEKYSVRFYIRPHPASKLCIDEHVLRSEFCAGLHKPGGIYKMNVVHTSGVLVEMIMTGEKFMIYKDEYLDDLYNLDGLVFTDVHELKDNFYRTISEYDFSSLRQYFNAANSCEDLEHKYRSAIRRYLLKEEVSID